MSQYQKIIARQGLVADVPALAQGEIGWDTDVYQFRVGDGTATPPMIATNKSTGNWDISALTSITLPKTVGLNTTAKLGGITIGALTHATPGLIASRPGGTFDHVTIKSNDNSLVVSGGDGQSGSINIQLHPTIIANLLSSSVLSTVTHDATMTGTGEAGNALSVVTATTSLAGITTLATQTEVDAGTLATKAVTPTHLRNLGGQTLTDLTTSIFSAYAGNTDATMSGTGQASSPYSVVQATEAQRGAMEIGSQTEVNTGVDNSRAVTPLSLTNIDGNSTAAYGLRRVINAVPYTDMTSLVASGASQTLAGIRHGTVYMSVRDSIPHLNFDTQSVSTTTMALQSFIGGVWVTICSGYLYRKLGTNALDNDYSTQDLFFNFSVNREGGLLWAPMYTAGTYDNVDLYRVSLSFSGNTAVSGGTTYTNNGLTSTCTISWSS